MLTRDKLFILKTGFKDPTYPGQVFYCWHCVLLEGLLTSFPELAANIDVERISWPRPRRELVEALGEENQSLPILLLADDADAGLATGNYEGLRFVDGKDAILNALSVRHGIPVPHP